MIEFQCINLCTKYIVSAWVKMRVGCVGTGIQVFGRLG